MDERLKQDDYVLFEVTEGKGNEDALRFVRGLGIVKRASPDNGARQVLYVIYEPWDRGAPYALWTDRRHVTRIDPSQEIWFVSPPTTATEAGAPSSLALPDGLYWVKTNGAYWLIVPVTGAERQAQYPVHATSTVDRWCKISGLVQAGTLLDEGDQS